LGGYNPISQVQSGQVTGLTLYQATLPNGAIQPGSFTVSASGGADVGAFQSTVQIGSPIQIQEGWAGRFLQDGVPALITWTGGDPNTWVTAKLTAQNQSDPYDSYPYMWIVPATAGVLTIGTDNLYMQYGQTDIQLIIEVVPDPSQTPAFSAPGLTLGGQTLWKYTYRFEGLTVVPSSTPPTQ
jgi:hypothetical protein